MNSKIPNDIQLIKSTANENQKPSLSPAQWALILLEIACDMPSDIRARFDILSRKSIKSTHSIYRIASIRPHPLPLLPAMNWNKLRAHKFIR